MAEGVFKQSNLQGFRMTIKFGSVCSGIEAASVAWGGLSWSAAWFSEIEKFPCAVLAHHYPDVANLGDMNFLVEKILKKEIEAPEVFCGGTPCQAFSVAGLRASLDDARGNLSLIFCEIANAIDIIRQQRNEPESVIFWENVPGVLNTKDNAFGCFLAGLAGSNEPLQPNGKRWTNAGVVFGPKRAVAWRLLDAQFFGVAQRRKRVFVVASARKGFSPARVLLESKSLQGDTSQGGKKRQKITRSVKPSVATDSRPKQRLNVFTMSSGQANAEIGKNLSPVLTCLHEAPIVGITLFENHPTDSRIKQVSISPTVISRWGTGDGNLPIALAENTIGRKPENGGNGDGFKVNGPMYTLNCTGVHGVAHSMQVRRLTPIECERLQGFPDNYTRIPYGKKGELDCPNGPRYKALGNSWAVPVVTWIGERINKELKK